MKLKYLVAAAATLASSSAFAGATGNVGAVSEYMFRGVSQGSGAAIQGGLDYSSDIGIYVGTWGSNIDWGVGGSEVDVYAGYTKKFNDFVGIDVGAIYYYYPEADEETTVDPNTTEFYAGVLLGPGAIKYYYTSDYFGSDESAYYLLGSLALPISETLSFTASVGLNDGDAFEAIDGYVDYSIGLAKTLDAGFTATFQIVDTDLEAETEGGTIEDDPQIVIGLKKVFDL